MTIGRKLWVLLPTLLIIHSVDAIEKKINLEHHLDVSFEIPEEWTYRNDLREKDIKRIIKVLQPVTNFKKAEKYETMQGGATTWKKKIINTNAFSHFSQNLSFSEQERFNLGNALFRKNWVSSPSSTFASDGLGPLFNARSCQACHLKDGRGKPPISKNEQSQSLLLRLARTNISAQEQDEINALIRLNVSDPVYGHQLQSKSLSGLKSEGQIGISYQKIPITLKDGSIITLTKPSYTVQQLAYGKLHSDTTLSPRVAQQMIGLGLIESIHPYDILKQADPFDKNKDGISGRVALYRNPITNKIQIGRFGWKAQNPTVRIQSASAFAADIGISSPLMNQLAGTSTDFGDCTKQQKECFQFPTGVQKKLGESEAPDPVLDLVTFYSKNLAVPPRRNVNNIEVLRGKKIFNTIGCQSCHTAKYVTSRNAVQKGHRMQLIWPYSDFLLHDMGKDLADHQQVGRASGREWRTPPLWGIGLTKTVSGHTRFLHDGRAKNLTEAILWHGGESKASQKEFTHLNKQQRQDLIAFLNSL